MIRYTLSCHQAHTFDGWFRNSDDFDQQCERGLVSCPVCGSAQVGKALMAPAVSTSRKKAQQVVPHQEEPQGSSGPADASPPSVVPETAQTQQASLMPADIRQRELIAGLRAIREKLIASSDYVGKSFAEEARKIHYGEAEERNIYGETSREDVESLLDEGIDVMPLPALPDEHN